MTYTQAKKHFMTQVAIARAARVSQSAVANWKIRGRIPLLAQFRLNKASEGVLRVDKQAV